MSAKTSHLRYQDRVGIYSSILVHAFMALTIRRLSPLLTAVALFMAPGTATAQFLSQKMSDPPTHGGWVGVASGPSLDVVEYPMQVRLSLEGGYHFSGRGSGPAGAIRFHLGLGNDTTTILVLPTFQWDIPVWRALLISPYIGAGYGNSSFSKCNRVACVSTSIDHVAVGFGAGLRLSMFDRFVALCRPLSVTLLGTSAGMSVTWDFLLGGGITWL